MKTITQTYPQSSHLAAMIAVGATIFFFILTTPVQALSCLNPAEMVNDYVSDERFSIAMVTAGVTETEGNEHDQTVTVQEVYKGTISDTVTFTYDDTWQYLCAGSPAEAGTEALYVIADGRVVQVISPESPLYSEVMVALENAPEVSNPEPVIEAKRNLMQQVIDLLQQLLSLLQGQPEVPVEEPDREPTAEDFIGMTVSEAEALAAANDMLFRVVEIDGEPQPTTRDYRPGRINAIVEGGVVVSYTIEGEEEMEEGEAGQHDEMIGMTQTEAEAYAAANDVPFRVGRIDEEILPVTMDYRPGRITAEIEDGVVVDYSVE